MKKTWSRNRTPVSCLPCRTKRCRCDRSTPCTRCVSDGNSGECHYVSRQNQSPDPQSTSIDYNDIEPSSDSSGSKFDGYVVLDSNLMYLGPTSHVSNSLEVLETKSILGGVINERTVDSNVPSYNDADKIPISTSFNAMAYLGELPTVKEITLLLNRFFDVVFPLAPIFDKSITLNQLVSLLQDKETHSTIDPTKLLGSALISILLIMLRFSYITIPSEEMTSFLSPTMIIHETYIDVASRLLMSLKSYKNVTITRVQALLLLRIYRGYCPEDDENSYSTSILNSVLVQSARILGLNQHPSRYPENLLASSEQNIWLVTWIHINYIDSNYSFDKGLPPLILLSEMTSFDIPMNKFLELTTTLRIMHNTSISVSNFLLSFSGNRDIDKSKLLSITQKIGRILNSEMRTFHQILSHRKFSYFECLNLKEFVLRLDLLYKEYVLVFLTHLRNDVDSKKYLSMAFERSLVIIHLCLKHLDNKTFSDQLNPLIIPKLWTIMKMTIPGLIAIFTKVLKGTFSINEAIKYFNCSDCPQDFPWIDLNNTNQLETLTVLMKNLVKLYGGSSETCFKNYSSFETCVFLSRMFHHLKKIYPELFSIGDIDLSNDNFGWKNMFSFEEVNEYWKKRFDLDTTLNAEFLFSGLNIDIKAVMEGFEGMA